MNTPQNESHSDFELDYRAWRDRCDQVTNLSKLFVIGCAKSGTTWLEKLLDGHPELHVKGEGRYFWSLAQNLQQAFANFNQSLPAQGDDHLPYWPSTDFSYILRATIEASLARSLTKSPPNPRLKIIGDKTPMHTLAVAPLHQLFPKAKFIHIIRDPRDATISQWLFWAKDNDPRPFAEFVEYSITKVWPLNVESARKAGEALGDLYTEVRYEDLLANTPGELTRLTNFLGVDTSTDSINSCLANGNFKANAGGREQGSDTGTGQLFRKGIAGDWKNHIPEELATKCCLQIKDLMESCNYDPNPDPAPALATTN